MALHSLMFGWEYPPIHVGGLGVACQGLVQGLLQHNVRITLVLPHPHPGDEQDITIRSPSSTTLRTIKIPSMLSPYQTPESFTQLLGSHANRSFAGEASMYDDMASAISAYEEQSIAMTDDVTPDVVHCHDWMTYPAGAQAARHHRKPLVAHIHATELDRTHFQPNEWIYACERKGLLAADRIIAVSQYTKNILTRHYGIPADRIAVVHNGATPICATPVSDVPLRRQHPLVLFLGRMVLQKGPMHFLRMAELVHAIRPDVQFVMAGEGHMLPEIMNEACKRGLEECMVFAGKVSNAEATALYHRADCFVMPSLSEPFGLVALEAAVHGTPVILSRQSGVAEVLDHALKVDFWDTEKMAEYVLAILSNDVLARQLRSEAPRVVQRLTWKNQAASVHAVYRDVIKNPSS